MRVSVRVGDVRIDVEGLRLSHRQVRALLDRAAIIATGREIAAEQPAPSPLGFTTQIEDRQPDYVFPDDE